MEAFVEHRGSFRYVASLATGEVLTESEARGGLIECQVGEAFRSAFGHIRTKKRVTEGVQRAHGPQVPARQAPKMNGESCDVAARVSDIIPVPIEWYRSAIPPIHGRTVGQDDLRTTIAAMASARFDAAQPRGRSFEPLEEAGRLFPQWLVHVGDVVCPSLQSREVLAPIRDGSRAGSHRVEPCQPSRAPFGGDGALAVVALQKNLLGPNPVNFRLEQKPERRQVSVGARNRKLLVLAKPRPP